MSYANGVTHPEGSGPSCRLCAAAMTNPYVGGETQTGCLGCDIREVSHLPQEARAAFYRTIANDEEREAFKTAVALEYRRRKKLIEERPMQ